MRRIVAALNVFLFLSVSEALAHSGHHASSDQSFPGNSLLHFLTEPEHIVHIALVVGLLCLAWRTFAGKRK